MKKILSLLAVSTVVSTSATNVVSCGTRVVESLNDPSYKIKGTQYLDITSWSASAIAAADYKSHFVDNMDDAIAQGANLNYSDLLVKDTSDNISDSKVLPFYLLADYQKNSNSVSDKKGLDDYTTLWSDFQITLWDDASTSKIIAQSDPDNIGTWYDYENPKPPGDKTPYTLYKPKKVKQDKNETVAYAFTFYLEISVASNSTSSVKFTGDRNNYVGYKDADGNVTKPTDRIGLSAAYPGLVDDNFNNVNGIYKENGKAKKVETSSGSDYVFATSFDYRFKVQFYIQLS